MKSALLTPSVSTRSMRSIPTTPDGAEIGTGESSTPTTPRRIVFSLGQERVVRRVMSQINGITSTSTAKEIAALIMGRQKNGSGRSRSTREMDLFSSDAASGLYLYCASIGCAKPGHVDLFFASAGVVQGAVCVPAEQLQEIYLEQHGVRC